MLWDDMPYPVTDSNRRGPPDDRVDMSTILQKEHATWNVTMTVYRPMLWDVFGAHVVGQLPRARNIASVPTNTKTALAMWTIFKMARNSTCT